jgi:hypothetical protein
MLITSSVPKNLVSRRYSVRPLRYQAVCSNAVRKASPIVTGTKKKWLIEVNANCSRARSVLVIVTDHASRRPPGPHPCRVVRAGPARPAAGRRVRLTPAGGGGQGPGGVSMPS